MQKRISTAAASARVALSFGLRLLTSPSITPCMVSQHITHAQAQPPYSYEIVVPCDDAITAKIFVIDDQTHSTMLLAEEY